MKRIIVILLLCGMLACVPTPEQDAVVNRGEEDLAALLTATPAPDAVPIRDAISALPKGDTQPDGMICGRLTKELSDIGGATARIDADVIVPDADVFPVYAVQKGVWSAAERIEILKAAADGAPIYQPGIYLHADKAYWEQVLREMEMSERVQTVDRNRAENGVTTLTEEVREFYRSAPQSVELNPFDEARATGDRIDAFYRADGLNAYVDFAASADRIQLSVFGYDIQDENYVRQGGSEFSDEAPGRELNTPSLTLDAATVTAQSFLARLGFPDAALSEAETLKAQRTHAFTLAVESEGWLLTFRKRIGGLPGISPRYPEANADGTAYAAAWPQERAVLYVDSDGVWSLDRQSPSVITETVNESVAMLDFDTILRYLEARLRAENTDAATRQIASVCVTRLQLGSCVTVEQDAPDRGFTLPVWIADYEVQLIDGRTVPYSITLSALNGASLHPDRNG